MPVEVLEELPEQVGGVVRLARPVVRGLAVGETVILLHPPLPLSRRFNRHGEGMSVK